MAEDPQRVAADFDVRAARYSKNQWHQVYAERLVELSGLEEGDTVLDAGVGTGFAALAIAQRVGFAGRVVGVDLSPGMLEQARAAAEQAGLRIDLVEADATNLPAFEANTFDAVVCSAALLYMPVDRALREWHRLIVPGGRIGFSTMQEGCPRAGRLFRACAAEFGFTLEDPSRPLGTADRCHTALTRAGFTDILVVSEHVTFTAADLAMAWESNLRSAAHAAVRTLGEADLASLHARFDQALRSAQEAEGASFGRADVFYVFGTKPDTVAKGN